MVQPDGGGLVERAQPLACGRLGRLLIGLALTRAALQRDAGALGQERQRLTEVHALLLLDEGEDVAVLATAEAAIVAFRVDVERRRALAVEGAEALECLARLPQRDDRADLIHDVELLLDALDDAAALGHVCLVTNVAEMERR